MTLEELKKEYPELCEQIRAEARNTDATANEQAVRDAVKAERQRIKDIESIAASIADKELVDDAKYGEKPMDAKDLAFAAMQKQAAIGAKVLDDLRQDREESGANNVTAVPAQEPENINGINDMTDDELDARIAEALQKGGKQV